MITNKSAIYPSVTSLYYSIYQYLSTHPLMNKGLVVDPITEQPVNISQYRLMGGFPTNEGLTCSIYPLFESGNLSSPSTISASVLYGSYDLGAGNTDAASYHFVVDFNYRSNITVDGLNRSTDDYLIKVPAEHITYPDERGMLGFKTKEVDLYTNPSLDVVADYLELARLALCDVTHQKFYSFGQDYRGTLGKVEPIHINFPTISWDKGTSVIDCRGYLLIRLMSYVTRNWRDIFNLPLEEVNFAPES